MDDFEAHYGHWVVVLVMVVLASWIFYRYVAPRNWREWRGAGLVQAFIIALYAEMYGFPLTLYLLTGFLGVEIPLTSYSGHLWAALLGYGAVGAMVEMVLGYTLLFAGVSLLIRGWRQVYRANQADRLATDGLYGVVRHPQYTGIFLALFGQIIHWPTIPTVLLFPVIVGAYVHLARKEEAEMVKRFGAEYLRYQRRTPRFFPRPGEWGRLFGAGGAASPGPWKPDRTEERSSLEREFEPFRREIVGYDQTFESPFGERRIIYADWTASGRLYRPIEDRIVEAFGPFVGNTHSESSVTGTSMTHSYHEAKRILKEHVNASADDVILTTGSGMTAAVNKLQRILGLRIPGRLKPHVRLPAEARPVVFVTHMEHHSNHTSWIETIADVEVIPPDPAGRVDVNGLRALLHKHRDRETKIGAFTACSNVTGIRTPYGALAKIMHEHGGVCFVDFAASAPYDRIDMHPDDALETLDAVLFSPHKFLGGPGTPGVVVFGSHLYDNAVPDHPGGGTVAWTNPWGGHRYLDDVEAREDGGTPPFLQTIKAALCVGLKDRMGVERLQRREEELVRAAFAGLRSIPRLHVLADHVEERLGILSFYVEGLHYNLVVKLLNDRFGVQVRGGCSCAGTYGHYLLHVDPHRSRRITDSIDSGDLSEKPGWVRLSLHPTTTDAELQRMLDAIAETVRHGAEWANDYVYSPPTNEFTHVSGNGGDQARVRSWFS